MRHGLRRSGMAALTAGLILSLGGGASRAAEPPEALDPGGWANVVRLPDGTVKRLRAGQGYVWSQASTDHGTTWGPQTQEFTTTGTTNPMPILDHEGELHIVRFLLDNQVGDGRIQPNINYFLHLWHARSRGGRATWSEPVKIFDGFVGSVMNGIETRTGRLVVPFGNRVPGATGSDPTGRNYTTAIYSDDGGATWTVSPSRLTSPVSPDFNGANEGAVEPAVVELNDGRLWMLMRTQAGRLYESYSTDHGATWSDAAPSPFYTSTGPPNLVRLDDGRLVLFWNNATMPARHENKVWYAGRDALHAAISRDDGRTWAGFREVYLDPYRHDDTITGDTGTAYPFPAPTHDGRILVIAGQARARVMLRIDPDWLEATTHLADFTGPDPLAGWSVFTVFGDVTRVKRERTPGPRLIDHPDPALDKPVLHLRRSDERPADGAMWNFPMAQRGVTSIRLMLQPGFAGGAVALTDRFFNPTDPQGDEQAVFSLPIAADGSLPGGAALQPSRWCDLDLAWDLTARQATVLIDGRAIATLDQRRPALPGLSYLRLRSTAAAVDPAGYLVDRVAHRPLPNPPHLDELRPGPRPRTDISHDTDR